MGASSQNLNAAQFLSVMKHSFILLGAITALLSLNTGPSFVPEPAFGEIVAGDVEAFATRDLNRLRGNVVRCLVRKSPYVNILDGGTMESGISQTQKIVVQERAVLNQSLVRPVFALDTTVAGTTGNAAEVGSTEYSYTVSTNRGKGPLVNIQGMWAAFKTAYSASEDALKKQIVQINNADVRINLVDRSGLKVIMKAGASFGQMFSGDIQAIDTAFDTNAITGHLPDAMPNIKFLQHLGRTMREDLLVEPWEGKGGESHLKLIGSQELLDYLRDDAGVRQDQQYIAAGSFETGKMSLTKYSWEGPYRGLAFGVDPQPLRFNLLNGTGQPIYIEPEISVQVNNNVASRPNSAWIHAKYEVALLMGQNSFRKLTPDSYTGEGTFKFPTQGVAGELMWNNIKDNDQNAWQDYGRHYYQFKRAYLPARPHAVCAIAFARQQVDFGLSAITSFGDWSTTASL